MPGGQRHGLRGPRTQQAAANEPRGRPAWPNAGCRPKTSKWVDLRAHLGPHVPAYGPGSRGAGVGRARFSPRLPCPLGGRLATPDRPTRAGGEERATSEPTLGSWGRLLRPWMRGRARRAAVSADVEIRGLCGLGACLVRARGPHEDKHTVVGGTLQV